MTYISTQWDDCLPLAQTAINNVYLTAIGDITHFALFHYDKRVPYDLINYHAFSENTELYPLTTDVASELAERAFKIFELTRRELNQ